MYRSLVIQGYLDFLQVLINANFYAQTLYFLFIFVVVLAFASVPFLLLPSTKSKSVLLTPIFGFVNLLFCLNLYDSVVNIFKISFSSAVFVLGSIACEIALLYILRWYSRPKTVSLTHSKPFRALILVFFFSYIFVTARHFDQATNTFFVPGYNINHDSMHILGSVKALHEPPVHPQSNLIQQQAAILFKMYPLGGTYLVDFFSHFFSTDPYFIYSRIIAASTLLILFAVPYLLISLLPKIPSSIYVVVFVGFFSFWNYFTLAMVNTSVLASTLSMVLVVVGFAVIANIIAGNPGRIQYSIIFLVLSGGLFLYSFVPYLILLVFLLVILVISRQVISHKTGLLLGVFFLSILTHHNLIQNSAVLLERLTSTSKEVHILKPSIGNVVGFLHPSMPLSLWISHPIHTAGTFKTINAIILLFLVIGWGIVLAKQSLSNICKSILKPPLVAIVSTITLLLVFTLFISRSPYQHTKVLQLLSYLWPVFLGILYFVTKPTRDKNVVVAVTVITMLASTALNFGYVGKPIVTKALELQQIGRELCSNPVDSTPLDVATLDEWALYWFYECPNVAHAFNRITNSSLFMSVLSLNTLHKLPDVCSSSSLVIPSEYQPHSNLLLTDNCLQVDADSLVPINTWQHHTLYQKEVKP